MLQETSSACCPASASAQAALKDVSIGGQAAPDDSGAGAWPIAPAEFADLIAARCPLATGAPVAVAVSGGGDSMALALLADAWARENGRILHTVTVDHRLRPDSADEAAKVHAWLSARGIRHDILAWTETDKPSAGLQAAAREARYRLIGIWARNHGIRDVLLAHQLEDQGETLMMRVARGSGIAGLAAMRDVVVRDGLRLCRPLLSVPRERLRATLRQAGQDWIEDPSNDSPRYTRTAFRRLASGLAGRGADARHLAAIADNFARLDALLRAAGRRFLGEAAIWRTDGSVQIDRPRYAALPDPIAGVVLRQVLVAVAGRTFAPRGDRLATAQDRLADTARAAKFTLGYCRFVADAAFIQVKPEVGRRPAIDI